MGKYVMASETEIKIIDKSAASGTEVGVEYTGPVYLVASASTKGEEEMIKISGARDKKKFIKKFGVPSFNKYGQASITAGILVEDGAEVIFKRIVAEDSTLANLTAYVQIVPTETQKKNDEGFLLYTDANTGEETIVAEGNTPIMITTLKIKHTCKSFPNVKSLANLSSLVKSSLDEKNMIYPIYSICDVGRGKSDKKIKITPDYNSSKRLTSTRYNIEVLENSSVLETLNFYMDHDIIENDESQSIKSVITNYSEQVRCDMYETYLELFCNKLAALTDQEPNYFINNDILFLKTKDGKQNLNGVELYTDAEDFSNISYTFGLSLDNGSNGAFGDCPANTEEYTNQIKKFYNGEITTDIYDIDNYMIDIIPDCNYPIEVKKAILELVKFRLDPYCFFDLGTEYNTYSDIILTTQQFMNDGLTDSMGEINHLYYDIIDPFTKKQITVTNTLELCEMAINHFNNGRGCPFGGQLYKMKYKRWIKGTENFIPMNTPSIKQRQVFIDNRINYAVKYNDQLYQESQVTSQIDASEASYINNIFNLQQVIKRIRSICPASRYSFIGEADLDSYNNEIENRVLSKYRSGFKLLELVYLQDPSAIQNKVYYAALNVEFKDFELKEKFLIYLLDSYSNTNAIN